MTLWQKILSFLGLYKEPTLAWQLQYSTVPLNGTSFTFPSSGGSVNYLVYPVSGPLSAGLSMTYTITGDGHFNPQTQTNNIPGDGKITLYFQHTGDNWSGSGPYEFYRWYCMGLQQTLQPGTYTIQASLDPEQWVSVFGKKGSEEPAAFQQALADVQYVGVVFGGGYFAGHGVFVDSGSSTFTIDGFQHG